MKHSWHATTRDAAAVPVPQGRRSAEILRNGSLEVRWYAPRGSDPQTPHDRDELYVVASGRADFVRGAERVAVAAGDLLFVPAGMAHRFEALSADFATWVMFYGPLGGERDNPFAAR
ncbi:MAG: cupin domain-containing protein [Betaproteobacteria bacterium]|nr:cupin domain-containing protein [Betaproteobacteria bacterium]MDH4325592.1 cupin domain-containing protein [Betaproteobacteria bacterium]MDH5210873.1 cupin domain-containing protein [Betaproteobacteria bacterium]MDH5577066.1 cupin domain-containing protein [Betaproteobacteria bacterium]